MAIVKISWSGGKDSTCAVLEHIKQGDLCKIVCYIPMLCDQIPLIQKCHYEYIHNTADLWRSQGLEVHIVTGISYVEFVLTRATRGKNKGKVFGYPCYITGKCNFKIYSKIKALNRCNIGEYDYEDIGIAFDETQRHNQLNEQKRSILCEKHITEKEALLRCAREGLLSPLYLTSCRDGCAVCPHKPANELLAWLNDYPEAKEILLKLDSKLQDIRPEHPPFRHNVWFSDVLQWV